jgi:hypothetical protein
LVWRTGTGMALILVLLLSLGLLATAAPAGPEELVVDYELPEVLYVAEEASLATGDPRAEHAVYPWPFALQSMGHAIQSYQYYGGSPYFHHGLDIMAPAGTYVYTRSGGQVVNIENYQPGNSLYWEVAILDPEGYLWQFHHIDEPTIPDGIWDKWYEYLADPINGGFVPTDTYIGSIVWWPVGYPGAPTNFHHIHLNILGEDGAYINGLEFHVDLMDPVSPELYTIGLLQNGQVFPGNQVTGEYGLYVRTRDLLMSDLYWLPPYEVTFSVDGGPVTSVWPFDNLPGGGDRYAFVTDYFVVPPTCGDYGCNDFWIDLGFTTGGQRPFPADPGQHTVDVWSYDFAGNVTTGSFTWTVMSESSVHVGDLDGVARLGPTNWTARVSIRVHNQNHVPVANATVVGTWSGGKPGTNTCTTNNTGRCLVLQRMNRNTTSVSFTVDSVTLAGSPYMPGENHDPDGDSDGTVITVHKP